MWPAALAEVWPEALAQALPGASAEALIGVWPATSAGEWGLGLDLRRRAQAAPLRAWQREALWCQTPRPARQNRIIGDLCTNGCTLYAGTGIGANTRMSEM